MNQISINEEFNEKALKHLIGKDALKRLSDALISAYPAFDKLYWLNLINALEPLALKPRVHLLRDELRKLLPESYISVLNILLKSLRQGNIKGFDLWPYTEFVQKYGLENLNASLDALKVFTTLFTSEWAVRPFIKRYQGDALRYLEECAKDKDINIRRWASEGTRPRLPWGERLHDFIRDPSATLSILELLKFDDELYVRKSVANHLNDITKDHPEFVVKTLSRWRDEADQMHAAKIDWIIHRSLRTLIKNGNVEALKLIGVSNRAKIEFLKFQVQEKVITLGERINFEFAVRSISKKPQKLVVDYIVHFIKANKQTTTKVFKLKTLMLAPNETVIFTKNHHFKKITTREYYSGRHAIEIQINGNVLGKQEWTLKVEQ